MGSEDLGNTLEQAASAEKPGIMNILELSWVYSKKGTQHEARDLALFRATYKQHEHTVTWLLNTCKANANATVSVSDVNSNIKE
jgi:hypothetical protein